MIDFLFFFLHSSCQDPHRSSRRAGRMHSRTAVVAVVLLGHAMLLPFTWAQNGKRGDATVPRKSIINLAGDATAPRKSSVNRAQWGHDRPTEI